MTAETWSQRYSSDTGTALSRLDKELRASSRLRHPVAVEDKTVGVSQLPAGEMKLKSTSRPNDAKTLPNLD